MMEPPNGKNQIIAPHKSFFGRLQSCFSRLTMAAMAKITYRIPKMDRLPLLLRPEHEVTNRARDSIRAVKGKREVW